MKVTKCFGCSHSWSTENEPVKCTKCNCEDVVSVDKNYEWIEKGKDYMYINRDYDQVLNVMSVERDKDTVLCTDESDKFTVLSIKDFEGHCVPLL